MGTKTVFMRIVGRWNYTKPVRPYHELKTHQQDVAMVSVPKQGIFEIFYCIHNFGHAEPEHRLKKADEYCDFVPCGSMHILSPATHTFGMSSTLL